MSHAPAQVEPVIPGLKPHNLYVNGHTRLITLIGKPAFHSVSPETHTLAYQKMGLNAVFLSFEVDLDDLPAVMEGFRHADGWIDITVTMPLKQAIMEYCDELADNARIAGAVNIVKKEADGTIKGYNSDGPGFMSNLVKQGAQVPGSTMTMVGPGGAGRAILVQAALDGVKTLNVFAREGGNSYNLAKELAQKIEAETDCTMTVYPLEDTALLKQKIAESDILVNGTNVGMGIGNTETPIAKKLIKPGMVVADVINTPRETQLIKDAQSLGCLALSGIGMNDEQAVVADRIRFGIEIPIDEIRAELDALRA